MVDVSYYQYFRGLDAKNKPNGLVFATDYGKRLRNNEKFELNILQSCFGHLNAIQYLLDSGFKFVANYIGCDWCSKKAKKCAGFGKIWLKDNCYLGGCKECGYINVMYRLK
jgi:hypothetical protein